MPQLKVFVELVKPRALVMIVLTTALAYMIAIPDIADWWVILHMSIGVAAGGAGSLALNQYMERQLDSQMDRTASRPIPSGRISARAALIYGWVLMLGGYIYLWFLVNPLCSICTIICGVSYLWWYTPLKRRSSFSSFVGAIPGGMLPLMGWAGARNKLEIGAWILFVILWLWQIPHALIISQRHKVDYERAGMKQLPIIAGSLTVSRQMVLNVLILIPVTVMPAFLNMTEILYPVIALVLGMLLFIMVVKYSTRGSQADAKRLFFTLTFYLPTLLLVMYFDKPS